MAHEGIYATSAECLAKLGDNYETDVNEAMINSFCLMAETMLNCAARKVFAANKAAFDLLPAGTRYLLADAASNMVAIYGLTYKPTGENGLMYRIEFENRVNLLRDAFLRAFNIIKEKKNQDFLMSGTI